MDRARRDQDPAVARSKEVLGSAIDEAFAAARAPEREVLLGPRVLAPQDGPELLRRDGPVHADVVPDHLRSDVDAPRTGDEEVESAPAAAPRQPGASGARPHATSAPRALLPRPLLWHRRLQTKAIEQLFRRVARAL